MNNDKILDLATDLLKNFTDGINNCKDITEYYELIISIFMFSQLVEEHFCDVVDMELIKAKAEVEDMKVVAKTLAEKVVKPYKLRQKLELN